MSEISKAQNSLFNTTETMGATYELVLCHSNFNKENEKQINNFIDITLKFCPKFQRPKNKRPKFLVINVRHNESRNTLIERNKN